MRPGRPDLQFVYVRFAAAAASAVVHGTFSPNLPAFLQATQVAVNFLSTDQKALSRHFSSPVADRFEGIEFADGEGGAPLSAGCAGHPQCRKETHHYIGDQVIFIGRVLCHAYSMGQPLVLSQGQCGSLIE